MSELLNRIHLGIDCADSPIDRKLLSDCAAELAALREKLADMPNWAEAIDALEGLRKPGMTLKGTVDAIVRRAETYREGVQEIESWAGAYPIGVFPEMTKTDWKNVAAILKEHGYAIDRISASNMRHVLKGVGRIARETLEKREKK